MVKIGRGGGLGTGRSDGGQSDVGGEAKCSRMRCVVFCRSHMCCYRDVSLRGGRRVETELAGPRADQSPARKNRPRADRHCSAPPSAQSGPSPSGSRLFPPAWRGILGLIPRSHFQPPKVILVPASSRFQGHPLRMIWPSKVTTLVLTPRVRGGTALEPRLGPAFQTAGRTLQALSSRARDLR